MFLRVQLPQLRVALLGGSLLVALHLLAEFGALQMLRYPTFTTAIYDQYRATFNGPGATMLAGVLVLLCLVLLLAEIRLRGRRGYARTGRGAARPVRPVALGAAHRARAARRSPPLVGLALVVPLASLGYWMVAGASTAFDWAALATTTGTTLGAGRRRRGRDHRDGAAHRLARRPRPGPGLHAAGAQHLPRQLGARASSSPWRW